MEINVIITGATGMVGGGVLTECLSHPDIKKILVITRKSCGVRDPKITEIIHNDFFDLSPLEDRLKGYDGCFFCLGVTSINKKEKEYFSLTYTLTMGIAERLARLNPQMVFCYISGAGTDSTENGNMMWARVKGKTENDLMKLPFKKVYAFRPGFLKPVKGQKNVPAFYPFIGFLYYPLRVLMPKFVSTISELARAMIKSVTLGYDKPVLEVSDIIFLSRK